ncbi:MAG: type II secretion system F family protein [Planctomycetota bacterium]
MHASAVDLAGFCDRLAIGLDAGVDVRKVLSGEATRATGRLHAACQRLNRAAGEGESLADAMALESTVFPPLVRSMVRVGEHSGRLPEVFRRLSRHYEQRVARGRSLRRQLAWPLFQLAIALAVCTLLIAIGGVLQDPRGGSLDLLGLGLSGTSGVLWFWGAIGVGACVATFAIRSLRDRPAPLRRLIRVATRAPVVGHPLRTLALERIAWTLRLLLDTPMDLRGVAKLSLKASGNPIFATHADAVSKDLGAGMPLSTALGRTGEFPGDLLDAVVVAEESGRLVESLDRLAERYRQEAERAVATLTTAAGALIWLGIAAIILMLVFRLFGFYTGVIDDALQAL